MMVNWIAKYVLNTEALLNLGEAQIGECKYKIISLDGLSFFNEIEKNEYCRLVELVFEKKEDETIEDAYIKGQDYIDDFIDRFCFISYSEAFQIQCLSVSVQCVDLNEEFELIYVHYYKTRKLNPIELGILDFKLDEKQKRYLRLLRSGILAISYEEKLLNYFTVLEQIALEETKETITYNCINCSAKIDTGNKKTNNYIFQLLEKFNVNKVDFKKITEYRGKIAHGGGKRNQTHFLEVNRYAIMLESPVYNLVIERINDIRIQNNCNPHIPGYPFIKSKFKYINDQGHLEYLGWNYVSKMQPSMIHSEKKSGLFVGVQLNENNQPNMPQGFVLPKLNFYS